MKYLVIYNLEGVKTAFSFDTHNDAVDYINTCTNYADKKLMEIRSTGDDSYRMELKNGKTIQVLIKEYPNDKVRFDLSYEKNGRHIETRRFTKRQLAVNYANKLLDEKYECYADEGENEIGKWEVNDQENDVKANLWLSLVILADVDASDYDILGIKPESSHEEIKQAFRRMAIKYHPDKGGDPKKFQSIHDAYERILNGRASRTAKQEIKESFGCMDMRYMFKTVDKGIKKNDITIDQSVLEEIRGKAIWLIIRGLLEAIIGGILTMASYSSATQNKNSSFTIFYGLMFVGVWNFFKGLYYYVAPEALLKKLKK